MEVFHTISPSQYGKKGENLLTVGKQVVKRGGWRDWVRFNIISAEPLRCHYQTVGTMWIMSPRPEDTVVINECNTSNSQQQIWRTSTPTVFQLQYTEPYCNPVYCSTMLKIYDKCGKSRRALWQYILISCYIEQTCQLPQFKRPICF